MLLSRSYWLPASLHKIGCSSSSLSNQTVRTPLVILSLQTNVLHGKPSWVCWAGRYGSSSSSSHAVNNSSRQGCSSKHKQSGTTTSSSNSKGRSKLDSSSSSNRQTHSRGVKSQPQQQGYDVPDRLEARSTRHVSSSRSSRAVGAEQQQMPSRPLDYHDYKSSRSSSNSSRNGISSAPKSSPLPGHAELLVIGAGAAGLTAAYFAALQGAKVTVLERTRESGKKILMSGGSRCNVLPLEVDLQLDYVTSSSSSAMRAVFSSWALDQCHDWLSYDLGLQLQLEEETNKWFPASNSSREVRDRLVSACKGLGVEFVYSASVEGLKPPGHRHADDSARAAAAAGSSSGGCWCVDLADGSKVVADRIVLCTGGRSFPAVGTDGTGYNLLLGLGHKLVSQYAALTPLKGAHPGGQQLAGLTLSDVRLSALKPNGKTAAVSQRGGLLFTHKGYSGPAMLDLSHWLVQAMTEGQQQTDKLPKLIVNWSNESVDTWQQRLAAASGATLVENLLRKSGIKERLAVALCLELGTTHKPLSQLKKAERQALLNALTAWELPITGHEGYKKAEVTGGGVVLEQIDCKTMESRLLPGLHLCGEVLDVFGRIGGFNFYWAWVTGRAAGLGAAAALAAAAGRQEVGEAARGSPSR